jgi:hypothetical protein
MREVVVDRMTWTYDRGSREFVRLSTSRTRR